MKIALFVIFVLLQVGDLWTTLKALRRSDRKESGRFMVWFMVMVGVEPALYISKTALIVVFGTMIYFWGDIWTVTPFLWMACGYYICIVMKNYELSRGSSHA
jgi:hypothetical protein